MINFLDNNIGDQRQTDANEMKEDSPKKNIKENWKKQKIIN